MKRRTKLGVRVTLSKAAGKECIELLENRTLLSTTYYVSPTGSDSNAGTSTGAPWATVAKVDSISFQPGDSILFQRGGEWHGLLIASSSGTATNPITYGDYGSGTKPIFDGSDVVPNTAFTQISGTTYAFPISSVGNGNSNAYWVYANHVGLAAATSLSSVESNTNSFYVDGNNVDVNVGTISPSGSNVYTLGDRGAGTNANSSLIDSNGNSYVTFTNLIGRETAEVGSGGSLAGGINDGYVYRIQGGSNITMNNIEGYYGSKHIIGAIDTTAFLCNGAVLQGAPEGVSGNGLPYGNATAAVSYADAGQNSIGDTHQWINVTVSNYDGGQPGFLTHNDGATSMGSILLQNFNSLGSPIALQPGTNVSITMKGGSVTNNSLTAYTSAGTNELFDGVSVTGTGSGYTDFVISGNATVQNCLVTNGNQGGIQVNGANNTVRFNTFIPLGYSTGIILENNSTSTVLQGNIITGTSNAISIGSGDTYSADYDFFDSTQGTTHINVNGTTDTLAQFQALGYETHGVSANPQFTSAGTGDYSLASTSPAINFVPTSVVSPAVPTDIRGFTRPSANVYDAGAYEYQSVLHQPTVATTAAANPNPVTGTTTALSVLGASQDGEGTLLYTWSTTGTPPAAVSFSANGTNAAKNTTATFTKAGSYTFQANISNGTYSTTSSVIVTVNQTATGVTISPSTMFVAINTTQQYTAIVADQFGFAVAGSSVTYSIQSGSGTISASGLFTAPSSTGTTIIKASSGGSSATATATITPPNQAPTITTAAASSSNPVTGTTTTLTVGATDDNGEANLTYTWSLIGTPPAVVTFSVNGTNAAKSTVATFTANGAYNFLVTVKDSGGLTTTSSVTVNVSTFVPVVIDGTLDGRYGSPIAVQTQTTNIGYQTINPPSAPYSQLSALYGIIDETSGQLDLFIAGSLDLLNAHLDLFLDSVPGQGAANTSALATSAASGGPWNTNGGFTQITFDSGFRPDHLFTSTYGGGYSLSYYNFDTNTEINNNLTDPATGLATSSGGVPYFTERVNNNASSGIVAANTGGGVTTGAEWAFNLSGLGYTTSDYNAGDPIGIMAFISFGSHTQATNQNLGPSSTIGYGSYSYFGNNFDFSNNTLFPGNQYLDINTPAAPAGPTIATAAAATPNPVTSGNTTSLSVLGADSSGEPSLSYTWSTTGTPPAAVNFSANGTNAAKNTIATFTANGTYNFLVTVTDLSNLTTTSTVTVTVSSFGATVNQAPTVATPAAANPNPTTGTTAALSVLGADDGGESNLTYTWATTGNPPASVNFSANGTNASKNSTATFTKIGSYNLIVTIQDAGGLTVTSSVTVVVTQNATTIVLTPLNVSVAVNASQQFAATVYDQFGNAMTSPSFTWSVPTGGGSISATGLYTAPSSTGSATVKVVSGSLSASTGVTITAANPNGPTVVNPVSAGTNPVTGNSTSISVLGNDPAGASSLIYIWSSTSVPANAPPVTFSVNGTNAAANTTAYFYQAGTYTLTATIKDPTGNTTTSSLLVTVNQTVTTLYVLPPKVILAGGASQQFSVRASDQFSNTIFSPPTTWSVTAGGTISSTGLFAGGQASGTYTVTAVTGGMNASTTVTVQASGAAVVALTTLTTVPNTLANIGTGEMVISDGGASGLATAEQMIISGANLTGAAGTYWKGLSGITSSAAASDANNLTAVGVILNNNGNTANPAPLYTTFGSAVTGLNDVLVKYTYYGDTNLDGKVDASDYSRIDSGFLTHATGWSNGDFNYDGVINGSDYTLMDNAFNRQGGAIPSSIIATLPANEKAKSTAAYGVTTAKSSSVFSDAPIASVASEIFDQPSSGSDNFFSGRGGDLNVE